MESVVDDLMAKLQGGGVDRLAAGLGASSSDIERALGSALPALVGGLAANASTPEGAGALAAAVAKDHDGSLLDAADPLVGIDTVDGAKILGHVFGGDQDQLTNALAARTGAGQSVIAQLLPMLAPLVLGWLGKRMQSGGGLDAGGLGKVLAEQQGRASQGMPDLGDILGSLGKGGGSGGGLGGVGDILDSVGGATSSSRRSGGGLLDMLRSMLGGGRR